MARIVVIWGMLRTCGIVLSPTPDALVGVSLSRVDLVDGGVMGGVGRDGTTPEESAGFWHDLARAINLALTTEIRDIVSASKQKI